MADVRITALPAAQAITGAELVPVVQGGLTVQTTVSAITSSPSLTQTFLTVGLQTGLPNSRYFSTGAGIGITDGGAQGPYTISLNGTSGSLETAGTGIIVKTAANTITARSFAVSGSGLSLTNGSGISGNPTLSLSGLPLTLANTVGTGLLAVNGAALTPLTITGTTSQIAVTSGDGSSGNPIIGIASNPVLPGTAAVQVPSGTTAQRAGSIGSFRLNLDTGLFEGYNGSWNSFAAGSGVTSIATGTGLTGGPITSTGTISIANTAVTAAAYGSSYQVPTFTVNAQGQLTLASNTTIDAVTLTTGSITTTPTNANDIANKSYVDSVAQGLDAKASCLVATTANITLSGEQTIDGVLTSSSRVLVKNQGTSSQNGIYVSSSGAWTRALDMDVWAEVPNAFTFIEQGTTQSDTGWVCTANQGGTIGVTAMPWTQFSGAGTYTAGTGLTLTGTQFSITNTAVTAAAYGSASSVATFTVNAQGQLTLAATTPIAIAASQVTSGTLAIAQGGTNSSATPTNGGVGYGTGTAHAYSAAGTSGQVLTSAGAASPTWTSQSSLAVGTSTNLAGGAAGSVPYQTGAGATSMLTLGTSGYVLTAGASAPQYVAQSTLSVGTATNATNATNTAITDDTSTSSAVYPTWVTANTGNLPQKVTSTKLSFVPSTGALTATGGISGGTF